MIKRIIPYAHDMIKEYVNPNSIVVDMTVGNGNDTLFLSKIAYKVYGFDIQEIALTKTKKLLSDSDISNVELIKDNHFFFDNYIDKDIDCFVFNLGYLPGGNKSLTTQSENTYRTILKCLNNLSDNGLVSITLYPGHPEGKIESDYLNEQLLKLPSNEYNVLKYQMINKNNSPYNIFIEKLKVKK